METFICKKCENKYPNILKGKENGLCGYCCGEYPDGTKCYKNQFGKAIK